MIKENIMSKNVYGDHHLMNYLISLQHYSKGRTSLATPGLVITKIKKWLS